MTDRQICIHENAERTRRVVVLERRNGTFTFVLEKGIAKSGYWILLQSGGIYPSAGLAAHDGLELMRGYQVAEEEH